MFIRAATNTTGNVFIRILLLCLLLPCTVSAKTLRIGVLEHGSANWELQILQRHGLAEKAGIQLELIPTASVSALYIGLQAGNLDLIIGDWIWVSRQRASGRDYQAFPYSLTEGRLLVHRDSGISKLEDLVGKRIGIAGGHVDKNWLLLRAYWKRQFGGDIRKELTPRFGTPPLVSELTRRGQLSAMLNFWHYAARLSSDGYVPILDADEMMRSLGIDTPLPLLVWIFDQNLVKDNREALNAFLAASYQAKSVLLETTEAWGDIRHLTRPANDAEEQALMDGYRNGVPTRFGNAEIAAAEQVYKILAQYGGKDLTGGATELSKGTFYSGFSITDRQ